MATHSSILAWGIPWTEEPGGLHSPWSHRVRTSLATEHACMRAHVVGRVLSYLIWFIHVDFHIEHPLKERTTCIHSVLFNVRHSSMSNLEHICPGWHGARCSICF